MSKGTRVNFAAHQGVGEVAIEGTELEVNRRFGGVAKLYGDAAYQRFQQATVVVVGLGGVGSWAAEALARSAIGHLVLIDFDHISESNTNRQLPALEGEYGREKVVVMAERLMRINPALRLTCHDAFLEPDKLDLFIPLGAVVLDATDALETKIALAAWSVAKQQNLVMCGGVGGKADPSCLRADDLAQAIQDPLLAKIRADLRKNHGFSRDLKKKMGIRAIYSKEPRMGKGIGGLACAGYGSAVTVTAGCGFLATAEVLALISNRKAG
jgi:tRNA A37 threonylcarbamoyladenosine dehydratase